MVKKAVRRPNFVVFYSVLLVMLVILKVSAFQQDEILYGDCGHLQFEDIDGQLLTKEEQLQLLDDDFESALNRSEKCLKTAIENSNQQLAQSSGGAGSSGGGNSAAPSTARTEPLEQKTEYEITLNETDSVRTKPHIKGEQASGSSAVCDAVRQGLDAASTDNERAHFESLAKQYKC